MPPGPVQTRLKVVVPVSADEDSVPDGARLPVHPLDAVQAVVFVLLHESSVVPLGATLVGLAVKLAVGAGGGATATVTELLASPPGPEQLSTKLVPDVSVGVASAPEVARLPVQPPDALHEVAFVLTHVSRAVPPYARVAESALRSTIGGAMTLTSAEAVASPPGPLQVSVKVVPAVRVGDGSEPLAGFVPVQPPDALHELVLVLLQESCVRVPLIMVDGAAVRLAAGRGSTVTGLVALAVPPPRVQVSVNVAPSVRAGENSEPLAGLVPLQLPDALHDVAFVLLHESCVVEPLTTLDGVAVRLTVGAGVTTTDVASLAVPPAPVHVSVNVASAERLALVVLPLVALAPDQLPDALHEVASVLLQESCVVAPLAMLDGVAVSVTVGGVAIVTVFVSLPVPPIPVQVSVNVVLVSRPSLPVLPLVALAPDQPPDALHDVASVLLQESCVVEPLATLDGVAVRLTVGSGTTVTDFASLPVPPGPVHVSVNVAFA